MTEPIKADRCQAATVGGSCDSIRACVARIDAEERW